jgi:hypothetical protein
MMATAISAPAITMPIGWFMVVTRLSASSARRALAKHPLDRPIVAFLEHEHAHAQAPELMRSRDDRVRLLLEGITDKDQRAHREQLGFLRRMVEDPWVSPELRLSRPWDPEHQYHMVLSYTGWAPRRPRMRGCQDSAHRHLPSPNQHENARAGGVERTAPVQGACDGIMFARP